MAGVASGGANKVEDRTSVMRSIEAIVQRVLEQIAADENPTFQIRKDRNSAAGRPMAVEKVALYSGKSRKRFAVMVKLLDEIHGLLDSNTFATKRDLFYRDVAFYETQAIVDRNLDAIARMLDVPRWRMNVLATAKGLIVGDLTYLESERGSFVDCSAARNGVSVPSKVHEICDLRSNARFVLLVEKDAIFQYLIDEGFLAIFARRCILVTGKGYGDLATRQLLRRLRLELNLPIFALMDADPHGLDIFVTYTLGTPATLYNELLTVPDMPLIGVLPTEITAFNLPADQVMPLTPHDRSLLPCLMQRIQGNNADILRRQIESLQTNGLKMEIQALYTLGRHYLASQYLPNKIVQHLPNRRY